MCQFGIPENSHNFLKNPHTIYFFFQIPILFILFPKIRFKQNRFQVYYDFSANISSENIAKFVDIIMYDYISLKNEHNV